MNARPLPKTQRRLGLLRRLTRWLELPMIILGFVWLTLLIWEFTRGAGELVNGLTIAIWIVFIVDFIVKFTVAPRKLRYLRDNWLTVIALAIPALRVFRAFSALRFLRMSRSLRGLRLVRLLASLNRGMKALGRTLQRRGFGYVVALTVVVTFAGAAGMLVFENNNPDGRGFHNFSSALWWTAMIMTTMASEYWPQTPEGRILCFLLALYAFAVFGYVTATLASFLVGREAADTQSDSLGPEELRQLRDEITQLRAELRRRSSSTAGEDESGSD